MKIFYCKGIFLLIIKLNILKSEAICFIRIAIYRNYRFLIFHIIISVMNQSFIKNTNASIINLFQKMDSNISKFRASLSSSPTEQKYSQEDMPCACVKNSKQRKIERQFYLRQQELVRNASNVLKTQGNDNFAKLLLFMSDCLARVAQQLNNQILCECKTHKIDDYANLIHKLSFLREENHKFFKMIQEKTEQCETLKAKLENIQSSNTLKYQAETPIAVHLKSQMPFGSRLSQEITSRMISSDSSRVSEFKHAWPQLTMPLGEVGHKRYFQAPTGNRCMIFDSRQVLQEKSLNHPFESTFRKTKIFDHH